MCPAKFETSVLPPNSSTQETSIRVGRLSPEGKERVSTRVYSGTPNYDQLLALLTTEFKRQEKEVSVSDTGIPIAQIQLPDGKKFCLQQGNPLLQELQTSFPILATEKSWTKKEAERASDRDADEVISY